MLFDSGLISSFLLASVALAHHDHEFGSLDRVERSSDATSNVVYNPYFSGAFWQMNQYTFNSITGTFQVPVPKGPTGSGVAIWVAIGNSTLCDGMFLSGVNLAVGDNNEPSYDAWWMWYPENVQSFSNFPVFAGDVVHVTLNAISNTTGLVLMENVTKNHTMAQVVDSTHALCGTSAGWIVDHTAAGVGKTHPLADFGTVTFTDAVAYGASDVNYEPEGAAIWKIKHHGKVLTSVKTAGPSVTIRYV